MRPASSGLRSASRLAPADAIEIGRAFLERALDDAATGAARTLVVSVPAPLQRPERLLSVSGFASALSWQPPEGLAFAALGSALELRLSGAARIERLEREAAELFAGLCVVSLPGCEPPSPRLFGGFAFAVGSAVEDGWREFGDCWFSLPRWRYARDGGRAWLSLACTPDSLEDRRAALREYHQLMRLLVAGEPPSSWDDARAACQVVEVSLERWSELVEAVRAEIESGRFEKIVAARRTAVAASEVIDLVKVLSRLAALAPGCTRFAFRPGAATFVGATPERLVARRGATVVTEALAGSSDAGQVESRAGLLSSRKDLDEHRLVVREMVRNLTPLCARLEVAERPRIRKLKDVLHLHTPIRGELKAKSHVLELVRVLHPTPAVGGVPTAEAVKWITQHEPSPRGWYAGPVGWFDAAGDGEFAVALRSGLVEGARAAVYVGAGIVKDSDPRLEYRETELKQRAMLGALGVRPLERGP